MFHLHVLLSVELGETSPRQRTLLRRGMLEQGWDLVGSNFMFSTQLRNLDSDEQAIARVTEQLNRALEVAKIVDWGADCFIKSKVGAESNRRLTSS